MSWIVPGLAAADPKKSDAPEGSLGFTAGFQLSGTETGHGAARKKALTEAVTAGGRLSVERFRPLNESTGRGGIGLASSAFEVDLWAGGESERGSAEAGFRARAHMDGGLATQSPGDANGYVKGGLRIEGGMGTDGGANLARLSSSAGYAGYLGSSRTGEHGAVLIGPAVAVQLDQFWRSDVPMHEGKSALAGFEGSLMANKDLALSLSYLQSFAGDKGSEARLSMLVPFGGSKALVVDGVAKSVNGRKLPDTGGTTPEGPSMQLDSTAVGVKVIGNFW